MTHTKEPWFFDEDWHRIPSITTESTVIASIDKGIRSKPEQRANALRIINCVNSLAGMNPLALKNFIKKSKIYMSAEIAHTDGKVSNDILIKIRKDFSAALADLEIVE